MRAKDGDGEKYIDALEASNILGVGPHVIRSLVREGRIGYRTLNVRARLLRSDVERIAEQAFQPAASK